MFAPDGLRLHRDGEAWVPHQSRLRHRQAGSHVCDVRVGRSERLLPYGEGPFEVSARILEGATRASCSSSVQFSTVADRAHRRFPCDPRSPRARDANSWARSFCPVRDSVAPMSAIVRAGSRWSAPSALSRIASARSNSGRASAGAPAPAAPSPVPSAPRPGTDDSRRSARSHISIARRVSAARSPDHPGWHRPGPGCAMSSGRSIHAPGNFASSYVQRGLEVVSRIRI